MEVVRSRYSVLLEAADFDFIVCRRGSRIEVEYPLLFMDELEKELGGDGQGDGGE